MGMCQPEHPGALLCARHVLDGSCAVCQTQLWVPGNRGSQVGREKAQPEEPGQGHKYKKVGGSPEQSGVQVPPVARSSLQGHLGSLAAGRASPASLQGWHWE